MVLTSTPALRQAQDRLFSSFAIWMRDVISFSAMRFKNGGIPGIPGAPTCRSQTFALGNDTFSSGFKHLIPHRRRTKKFSSPMHYSPASCSSSCHTMIVETLTIRKRTITRADIADIQSTVTAHWDCGRTEISRILCSRWGWLQQNGRLKDMACREVILTLNRKGLIQLPPGRHDGRNGIRNRGIPVLSLSLSTTA
jgi:hypothetical protein